MTPINLAEQKPTTRCALCGKAKAQHRPVTQACPVGLRTPMGYTRFSDTARYTPKKDIQP